jgi:hypothetical protein
MRDQILFLRKKACALRELARRAPVIADELRGMADELDGKAAELERNRQTP